MAELINERDTLNEGRKKINKAITDADEAKQISEQADIKATEALNKSESTQEQLNQVVIDGDSSVEAAQARVDEKGQTHSTLKDRIDDGFIKVTSQLAETDDEIFKSSLVNHKVGGFKVWWIDDDGHKGVYTKLAPLLREYGIKMSAAIITNRPHGFPIAELPAYDPNSKYMSFEQMKELENEGIVEFVPHSHTHDLNHRYTDMTLDEIHDDMSTCKSIMRKLGWNYKDLVYPFGAQNSTVRNIARQYYRSAINISGGAAIPPINQFNMPRIGMDTRDTQVIIDEINNAYENDTLIILMSHVDQYGGLEEAKIRAVIEHVHSLGGEFITSEQAIGDYGNLLQVGDDSISYDGNFFGGRLGAVRHTRNNEFLANNHPNDYRLGITITKIDQTSSENTDGLPANLAGTLITYKTSTEAQFVHQMFMAYRRSLIAYRSSTNNGEWRDWSVQNYVVQGEITFDDTTPPKDFPVGTTTMTVTAPNATETPNRQGGILKTIKTSSSRPLWTYQEFYDVTNDEKFIRGAEANDNEWREWKKIVTSSI